MHVPRYKLFLNNKTSNRTEQNQLKQTWVSKTERWNWYVHAKGEKKKKKKKKKKHYRKEKNKNPPKRNKRLKNAI